MNVNTATKDELMSMPGIGPKTADKIIAHRPIASTEEFGVLIPPAAALAIKEQGAQLEFPAESVDEGHGPFDDVPTSAWATTVISDVEKLGNYLQKRWGDSLIEGEKFVETAARLLEQLHPSNQPQGVDGLQLRRILPTETPYFESRFGTGAKFMCVWNMRWGPSMEPVNPNDAPTQAEIAQWFEGKGMHVGFAHYAPSVQVQTRARGFVPLVLFEIIEEKEKENGEADS